MTEIKREFVFKVVLMGEGSVGKTSIRSRFMGTGFKADYIKTIGADFASKAIEIGQNKVHFQVWDLAGQKMYKHVRSSFYSGCKCGFLVFDLTVPESLYALDTWVEEAIQHSNGLIKIFIILGNKNDLKDQIKVGAKDVAKLQEKLEARGLITKYLETSALTGENIQEAFETMGRVFVKNEGFPRKGIRAMKNNGQLISASQPHQKKVVITSGPETDNPASENRLTNESPLNLTKVENHFSSLTNRLNRIVQITAGLEERILLLETQMDQLEKFKHELQSLKESFLVLNQKVDTISQSADGLEASFPPADTSPTEEAIDIEAWDIPLPTIDELAEESSVEGDAPVKTPELSVDEITANEQTDSTTVASVEKSIQEPVPKKAETPPLVEPAKETAGDPSSKESLTAAKTSIPQQQEESEAVEKREAVSQPRCPKCGGTLSYIRQYERWYCYSCKIYV